MIKFFIRSQPKIKIGLFILACFSLIGLFLLEKFPSKIEEPFFNLKIEASQTAKSAMLILKSYAKKENIISDPRFDPQESGLIGLYQSSVTSNAGVLSAKQTSINPNYSAIVIHYLKDLDLKEGDTVAVGLTGSFPALNISVYSALKIMKLNPIIVSSASASQWGANRPDFLWMDMENILFLSSIFPFKSGAASLGGVEDKAIGISQEGIEKLKESFKRNEVILLKSDTFESGIDQRMQYFREKAGKNKIKAYINVGGGTLSVGTKVGKKLFRKGTITEIPEGVDQIDSVILRFLKAKIPVVNLVGTEVLAKKYGFPLRPSTLPEVGEGKIFYQKAYNQSGAILLLVLIVGSVYLLSTREDSNL
jgi:poly-gamma-glutamate system protein